MAICKFDCCHSIVSNRIVPLLCSFCRQTNRVPYDRSPNWVLPCQLVAVPNRNSGHFFQAQKVPCQPSTAFRCLHKSQCNAEFFFTPQLRLPALVCVGNKFLHHISFYFLLDLTWLAYLPNSLLAAAAVAGIGVVGTATHCIHCSICRQAIVILLLVPSPSFYSPEQWQLCLWDTSLALPPHQRAFCLSLVPSLALLAILSILPSLSAECGNLSNSSKTLLPHTTDVQPSINLIIELRSSLPSINMLPLIVHLWLLVSLLAPFLLSGFPCRLVCRRRLLDVYTANLSYCTFVSLSPSTRAAFNFALKRAQSGWDVTYGTRLRLLALMFRCEISNLSLQQRWHWEKEAKKMRKRKRRKCQWKQSGKRPANRRQRAIGLCHIVKFYFDLLVSIYFAYASTLFSASADAAAEAVWCTACLAAPLWQESELFGVGQGCWRSSEGKRPSEIDHDIEASID